MKTIENKKLLPLTVTATDEPDAAGRYHRFEVRGFPSDPLKITLASADSVKAGQPDGVTIEALQAVIAEAGKADKSGKQESRKPSHKKAAHHTAD